MKKTERFPKLKEELFIQVHMPNTEKYPSYRGFLLIELRDEKTGDILYRNFLENHVTKDAGIHIARLMKDNQEPNFGAYMLAVGTGATGSLLSPDAPNEKQRKLNAEIARKPFSSTTFRNSSGTAVAYPTNIIDLTTQFTGSEAVGPLNEMGIISPISSNPVILNPNPNAYPTYDDTVDVTLYDILLNYLTFAVFSKPLGAVLWLTWRFIF